MKPPELVKLFYRIGEVSQIVGVQPHVLRYWETEFRNIRPQKSNKGQRIYSRRDVEKLLCVKDLLRNQGFTIAGARRRLREPQPVLGQAPSVEASAAPQLSAVPQLSPASTVSIVPSLPTSLAPVHAVPIGLVRAPLPVERSAVVPTTPEPEANTALLLAPADRSAKPMRRALVALREELIAMMAEIDGIAAPSPLK